MPTRRFERIPLALLLVGGCAVVFGLIEHAQAQPGYVVRGKAMAEASIESDGIDVVSLKPGYRVFDKDYPAKLIVECDNKSSAIGSPD